MNKRVIEDDAPRSVIYLVQPIPYAIAYENAKGSSIEADAALAGVTSDAGTSVAAASAAGKNPTQYTVKDRFTLKNPDRVQAADGKWYAFSHWTLGDGTTTRAESSADSEAVYTMLRVNLVNPTKLHPLMNTKKMHPLMNKATYTTLRINPGTIGDLTFIANWTEVPANDLVVTPEDPGADLPKTDDPLPPTTTPDDPDAPEEQTNFPASSERLRALGLAQTGDGPGAVPCLTLAALFGLAVTALSIRKLRKS